MIHPTLIHADEPVIQHDEAKTLVAIYDPTVLESHVQADLTVTLNLFGLQVTTTGERRDAMLSMLEDLLKEFEAKAVTLDIQEGNYD